MWCWEAVVKLAPQLHPGFDAMFCIAKLIEMLTMHPPGSTSRLPQNSHSSLPLDSEGALMRHQ